MSVDDHWEAGKIVPKIITIGELDPELPVLFTHVPKTGGSTVTRGMATIFEQDQIAGISSAKPEQRHEFLKSCHATGKRYVYGHFRYTDAAPLYEEANYIIALRGPVERILSFYFMMLRGESQFARQCAEDVRGAGFRKFHEKLVLRRRQDNLICRYLCGEADHMKAIDILQRRYRLAWSIDGADLAWMALHVGLTGRPPTVPRLSRRNDAPIADTPNDFASGARPKDYATFLPPKNAALVEEANSEDLKLYDWFTKAASEQSLQSKAASMDGGQSGVSPVAVAEQANGNH